MGMEVHDEIMGTPAGRCDSVNRVTLSTVDTMSLLLSLKVYCVLIEVLSLL